MLNKFSNEDYNYISRLRVRSFRAHNDISLEPGSSSVLILGSGSEYGDDAQYYLGESYFFNKEYILAIAEYEKLTRKMGFSPFVEKARFKICEAYRIESPSYYHDQNYTEKALSRYQEFLDDTQGHLRESQGIP